MRKILFISTGGTIASRQTETGLAPQLDGQLLLKHLPELDGICKTDCVQLFNLDSSNMQPHHWSELAQKIVDEYENYDGFVISHGTDTMAYSSSALSVMLKGIGKPVAITGSQLPIENPKTDGKRNLRDAFYVAADGHAGVWLVFAGKVIKGGCAEKVDTEAAVAFESINEPDAAYIADGKIIWKTDQCENMPVFAPKTAVGERVFVYKLIPGAKGEVVDFAVKNGYKAIVIEAFGAGGIPNGENSLLEAIERAIKAGVKVVCLSQCLHGGVNMELYDVGIRAKQIGVISGGKKTLETVVAELMCK